MVYIKFGTLNFTGKPFNANYKTLHKASVFRPAMPTFFLHHQITAADIINHRIITTITELSEDHP